MKKRYLVLFFTLAFALFFWSLVKQAGAPLNQEKVQNESIQHPDVPVAKATKEDLIVVDAPLPDAQVSSPLLIKGSARGNWFFEGTFPITVTDWDGKIIGEGYATAQGDWMTTEFVPFRASITYVLPADVPYRHGYLILKKDNPSGDPQLDDALEFKINL